MHCQTHMQTTAKAHTYAHTYADTHTHTHMHVRAYTNICGMKRIDIFEMQNVCLNIVFSGEDS